MHDDGYFDEAAAAIYDEDSDAVFGPEVVGPVVAFLAERADGGAALEFGVGTGRIALPLSGRGVEVHGIDVSRPMLRRLRSKTGSEQVVTTVGDFATTRVEADFSLVYLVFNTIGNLTTQDAQVACFRNAADHLRPGGRFVIEVGVPDLRALPPGASANVFALSDEHWGIDEYDVANQRLVSHHFRARGDAIERFSMPFRYVWPAELDLMARLAGLVLDERYANWSEEPFSSESTAHVSVWRKPGS